jgi:hypothetical protein
LLLLLLLHLLELLGLHLLGAFLQFLALGLQFRDLRAQVFDALVVYYTGPVRL